LGFRGFDSGMEERRALFFTGIPSALPVSLFSSISLRGSKQASNEVVPPSRHEAINRYKSRIHMCSSETDTKKDQKIKSGATKEALDDEELPVSTEFEESKLEEKDSQGYSLRARLREETEAPFRKVRLFVYYSSAASAALGALVAFTRILGAIFANNPTGQPLSETVPNVLIDLGVVGAAVLLIRADNAAGKKRLDRLSRGAALAALTVEDELGIARKLSYFRLKKRPVIVCGNADTVNAVMASAFSLRKELTEREVVVVPFIKGEGGSAVFESWESGEWLAKPLRSDAWSQWMAKEAEAGRLRLSDMRETAFVVIVRKDGRVGSRSVGAPMWEKLIAEIDKIPKKDKIGRP